MEKASLTCIVVFAGCFLLFADNDSGAVAVGVFSKCLTNGLPCGWEKFKEIKRVSLHHDTAGGYVNVTSIGDVEGIGKRVKFKSSVLQWIRWRWKVRTLPRSAREDVKKKNDSAAGLFIAFKGMCPFNHVLKYVWSTTMPVGAIVKSPYYAGEKIIVIRSGPEDVGKWMPERRNIFNDYKAAFHSDPPAVVGIAIQSDSDNTNSSASADFADIIASRK